jgi:large subunit ribosomal protein L3
MAIKAIVGEKVGMTQIWDERNRAVPVTLVKVAPMRVVQVKTPESDGYAAIQVTYGLRRAKTLNKPQAGHFSRAGVEPGRRLVELRVEDSGAYAVGQELDASLLAAGEKVDVTGVSKGKGFAGPMARHNFKGQGASHGNHKKHRSPGAIGACATPARVFKGTKMAGQLGAERVTTLNLEVVQADAERELVMVRGAVPGPRGGLVLIRQAVKAGPGGRPNEDGDRAAEQAGQAS